VREAWGFNVGAQNEKNRGKAAKFRGRSEATGTLLSSGAQATGMWANAGYGKKNTISLSGGGSAGIGAGG
jgi:hypothetical protein